MLIVGLLRHKEGASLTESGYVLCRPGRTLYLDRAQKKPPTRAVLNRTGLKRTFTSYHRVYILMRLVQILYQAAF